MGKLFLAICAILLLAELAAAQQQPPTTRMGNTLWAPAGVADVRLPVMSAQTANYNPLYTGSALNSQGTDASTIIPFNCPSGCVTLMPRSTSAVFPPNSHVCFVNEGTGTLQVGSQDNTNSPVDGAPLVSNAIQLPQYGSVCLRAKANNHYEMVGPSVLPGGSYKWTGAHSAPACPLTAGATITINLAACASDATKGIANNSVTLNQNASVPFPAGVDGQFFGLRVNHGTGPFSLSFGSGFSFGSAALSGGQPTLCSSANCIDVIVCTLYNAAAEADCTVAQSNLTAVTPTSRYTIGAHTPTTGGCGGSTVTTCPTSSVSFTSTSSKAVVASVHCANTACSGTPPNVSSWTGNVSGCALLKRITGGGFEAWLCSITSTAAGPVTANYASSAVYAQPIVVEVAGVPGLAADGTVANTATGTGTAASVQTNGNASANDFLLGIFTNGNNVTMAAGAGFTLIDMSTGTWGVLDQWSGFNAAGLVTVSATLNSSDTWNAMVIGLH